MEQKTKCGHLRLATYRLTKNLILASVRLGTNPTTRAMTFWTSSEHFKDIRKQLREPSNIVDSEVKKRVDVLDFKSSAKKWAVIYMIAPEPYLSVFPEVSKWSSRRTVLEFRLIVDYALFKEATERKRVTLLLDCLRRSIGMMGDLGVEQGDREKLLHILSEVDQLFGG